MATPVKKASMKKMQKGGPSPMDIRMSDSPMTPKEKRKAKSDTKATMRFAKKNPGLKMQTGGTAKGKTVKPKPMPDFVKKGNQLYSEGKIEEGKKVEPKVEQKQEVKSEEGQPF
jgi:hypothetical protein